LSIAESIVEIVLQHIPEHVMVQSVKVRLGRLSGVVPESLEFCFSSIIDDTPLHGARLVIEPVPVRSQCRVCRETFTKEDDTVYICPTCGSTDLQFISGTDLQVIEVSVADDEA
jgi:hydrogenase nickel incorporation protein HypA/HybF